MRASEAGVVVEKARAVSGAPRRRRDWASILRYSRMMTWDVREGREDEWEIENYVDRDAMRRVEKDLIFGLIGKADQFGALIGSFLFTVPLSSTSLTFTMQILRTIEAINCKIQCSVYLIMSHSTLRKRSGDIHLWPFKNISPSFFSDEATIRIRYVY
jgi:hypothetical protein